MEMRMKNGMPKTGTARCLHGAFRVPARVREREREREKSNIGKRTIRKCQHNAMPKLNEKFDRQVKLLFKYIPTYMYIQVQWQARRQAFEIFP